MSIDDSSALPANLVLPRRTDTQGQTGPTPGEARGPRWRRTSRGFYVPSAADGTVPEQRILEAAVLLPREGGLTGWAALRWMGGYWFGGFAGNGQALPVSLATSEWDVRPQSGVRVSAELLRHDDIVVHNGVRTTIAVRSTAFEMRHASSVRAAVRAADMAAYSDLVSLMELDAYLETLGTWTGIPQAREALMLADENAWSPAEVDLRLLWQLDAGFPRPLCNVPVFDRAGKLVGTPDILDIEAGVAGEYDGPLHLVGEQRARDIRREGRFRAHGLEYFTMVAADRSDRSDVLARMNQARARARWEPESRRTWTVEPPDWWTPTVTVAQRRQLTERQRDRLLRHRLQVA